MEYLSAPPPLEFCVTRPPVPGCCQRDSWVAAHIIIPRDSWVARDIIIPYSLIYASYDRGCAMSRIKKVDAHGPMSMERYALTALSRPLCAEL